MSGSIKTVKKAAINKSRRPVYLNLFKIRLPVMGFVSLAHRASGILLFIAIPFVIYLLDLSVISSEGFDRVMTLLKQPYVQFLEIALLWALTHHFFAGIRFLLIDADIGIEKKPARFSAWIVLFTELLVVSAFICELTR
jgi:succinate dehydrogenase / fumarate reductase cytochrome b subunit